MPEPNWSNHIEYDSSKPQLVIYGYEVKQDATEEIKSSIECRFDWINSVWITQDMHKQVTIDLEVITGFQRWSALKQYESFVKLIQFVLKTICWSPSRTVLTYNGTTYRINFS